MTISLSTFTYEFDKNDIFSTIESFDIRVVDHNSTPWFIARDVATLLGYLDSKKAVDRHCKYATSWKDLRKGGVSSPLGLHPQLKLIPESDLYRLIMRSDMPEAVRFQDWVTEEILPTIRRTGGVYMTEQAEQRFERDPYEGLSDYQKKRIKRYEEMNWAPGRIAIRMEALFARNSLTSVAQTLGLSRNAMKRYSNTINQLLTGMDTATLRRERCVKETRDGLNEIELAAVKLIETIAAKRLKECAYETFEEMGDREFILFIGPIIQTIATTIR